MKKDNSPLIVAVFLAIGGLLSSPFVFNSGTGMANVAAAGRDAGFLISSARGAENAAALFSAQAPSPVAAVSDGGTLDPKSVFSTELGAVKSGGAFAAFGASQQETSSEPQTSSLSR